MPVRGRCGGVGPSALRGGARARRAALAAAAARFLVAARAPLAAATAHRAPALQASVGLVRLNHTHFGWFTTQVTH